MFAGGFFFNLLFWLLYVKSKSFLEFNDIKKKKEGAVLEENNSKHVTARHSVWTLFGFWFKQTKHKKVSLKQ